MDSQLGHSQQALPSGWECALDPTTQHCYYFNRITGTTSWAPPHPVAQHSAPGFETEAAATAPGPASSNGGAPVPTVAGGQPPPVGPKLDQSGPPLTSRPAAASGAGGASAAGASSGPSPSGGGRGSGWYYRDRAGSLHGPFQQDHLRAWRSFLPMDLLVWYVELQPPPRQQQQQAALGAQALGDQGESREAPAEEAAPGDAAAREVAAAESRQEAAAASLGLEGYSDAQAGGSDDDEVPGDGIDSGTAGQVAEGELAAEGGTGEDGGAAAAAVEGDGAVAGGGEDDGVGGEGGAAAAAPVALEGNASDGDADGGAAEPSPKRARRDAVEAQLGAHHAAASGEAAHGSTDGPTGQPAGPASAAEAIACGLPGIELAELLGDGPLLSDWRNRFPGRRPPGTSPPAPVHDHWLRSAAAAAAAAYAHGVPYNSPYGHYPHAAAGAAAAPHGSGDGDGDAKRPLSREESMLEYAAAVLSGLPEDDEAVVLARQAAAAGRSLADVVGFSWGAGQATYGASAAAAGSVDEHGVPTEYVRDPRSGRLTAVGQDAAPQNTAKTLYGEYGGWVDPDQMEGYLAKAKRWRQEQLPQLWSRKKIKEQREAKAKRAARAAAGL